MTVRPRHASSKAVRERVGETPIGVTQNRPKGAPVFRPAGEAAHRSIQGALLTEDGDQLAYVVIGYAPGGARKQRGICYSLNGRCADTCMSNAHREIG